METKRRLVLASDHAGYSLKNALVKLLAEEGYPVEDVGTYSAESCDYPDYAVKACEKVTAGEADLAILCCGTGIGMSMAANRIPGIRAALCGCEFQARACRQHNNANVLCLGERVTGPSVAQAIAENFLDAEFEGGRHLRRINLFDQGFVCEA